MNIAGSANVQAPLPSEDAVLIDKLLSVFQNFFVYWLFQMSFCWSSNIVKRFWQGHVKHLGTQGT